MATRVIEANAHSNLSTLTDRAAGAETGNPRIVFDNAFGDVAGNPATNPTRIQVWLALQKARYALIKLFATRSL